MLHFRLSLGKATLARRVTSKTGWDHPTSTWLGSGEGPTAGPPGLRPPEISPLGTESKQKGHPHSSRDLPRESSVTAGAWGRGTKDPAGQQTLLALA